MSYNWTQKVRKVNGKNRLCKVRTRNGKTQVRLIRNRNLTDKTAKSYGRDRIKNYYSSTDRGSKKRKIGMRTWI